MTPWLADLLACRACGCRAEAQRVVPGVGPREARVLVLGQNPGEDEDETGVPFVGRGGLELAAWLATIGLARSEIYITNIVKCHTARNRAPRPREASTCRDLWLEKELAHLPHVSVILALGRVAFEAILGKLANPPQVLAPWAAEVTRGSRILHVVWLPHPAFLLRSPHLKPQMTSTLLPWVRRYLQEKVPHVFEGVGPEYGHPSVDQAHHQGG